MKIKIRLIPFCFICFFCSIFLNSCEGTNKDQEVNYSFHGTTKTKVNDAQKRLIVEHLSNFNDSGKITNDTDTIKTLLDNSWILSDSTAHYNVESGENVPDYYYVRTSIIEVDSTSIMDPVDLNTNKSNYKLTGHILTSMTKIMENKDSVNYRLNSTFDIRVLVDKKRTDEEKLLARLFDKKVVTSLNNEIRRNAQKLAGR